MKRTLALILSLCMAFSLVACGQKESGETKDPSNDTHQTAQAKAYTWGACSSSSGYYALNVAVSDVINKNVDNISMTVMETGRRRGKSEVYQRRTGSVRPELGARYLSGISSTRSI